MKLYLSLQEKQFLLRKYMHKYKLNFFEAQKEVDKVIKAQKRLVRHLQKKNRSPQEIEQSFNMEFEKLCNSL